MKSEIAFSQLKAVMDTLWVLKDETFAAFQDICKVAQVQKNHHLLHIDDQPTCFYFVCNGLIRSYTLGGEDQDKEITKNFFDKGSFPASIIALLKNEPSKFALQSLEDSDIIVIDHAKYRHLLARSDDLKSYHIQYLEKSWMLDKEPQEISLLSEDSLQRYRNFMARHPALKGRVKLHYIASHLGITPTQLSRIRKEHGD